MVFRIWVLSEPNPNLNGYPIEPETFKIPKKKILVPNMILIPNMYPKYTKILFLIFFILWELVFSLYAFIYLVFFLSITMLIFRLILNDHVWCFFLIFESISLMFWLQNMYKSSTFKTEELILLMFWLKIRYKSSTFKSKNRLGPESISGCTGSLKIY